MFGNYNALANQRLYDAAARLATEQYRADRGAFFRRCLNSNWRLRWRIDSITRPTTAATSTLLTGLVGEAPALDLLVFQRQSAQSAA